MALLTMTRGLAGTTTTRGREPGLPVNPTSKIMMKSQQQTADTTAAKRSSSSSSASAVQPETNYYNDLYNIFQQQNAAARDAAINAIIKNLEGVRSSYQGKIKEVGDEYDRLIDENELKKERARRITRENQANRGQLESGLGRQELLSQDIGYNKITSNLNSAKTKAINDIYNLITQAEAEAENNKANISNNYANALLQYRLANM